MNLPLIRPATAQDLPYLIQCAKDSGCGITSLPNNPSILEKKLDNSIRSFHERIQSPSHETYLFCLEYEGKVVGISGIVSRIGVDDPFFAYHIIQEPLRSSTLNIDRSTALLHFTRARKKPTEIGMLFLEPPFRKKGWGKLLSFSRFLFIAQFRMRFAPVIIAELRGMNEKGYSPFWEAVGRPFFQLDLPQADMLRTDNPAALEEIFPKHPIYIDLLPSDAQQVIGETHPETKPAQKILFEQGFTTSHYVDLFDAGPHLFAHRDEIDVIRRSQLATVQITRSLQNAPLKLASNTNLNFRATLAPLLIGNNTALLTQETAALLHLTEGDLLCYY
jgi:arginine N-succinyltransferase